MREKLRSIINPLKMNPCLDCGFVPVHPSQMDYGHRGSKQYDVSFLVGKAYSLEKILIEIGKCDLVCANCHRLRTVLRMS